MRGRLFILILLIFLSPWVYSQPDTTAREHYISGGLETSEIRTQLTDFLATSFGYNLQVNRNLFSIGVIYGDRKYLDNYNYIKWARWRGSFSLRGVYFSYRFMKKPSVKKDMSFFGFFQSNLLFYRSFPLYGNSPMDATNISNENIVGYGFMVNIVGGLSMHQTIGAGHSIVKTTLEATGEQETQYRGSYLLSMGFRYRFGK